MRVAPGAPAPGVGEQSAKGLHVFPGLIDCHVHFGMGEKITEYATETANAAQGGFTTVLGYFLNNEAYGDVFRRELQHAVERAHVDFGFHFSTANEVHIKELGEYVKDYGVTSFKYFMNFKGEEGRYRAATCESCRGYVKMVSTLSALSGPQLLVVELATMHLDLAALARNYLQHV